MSNPLRILLLEDNPLDAELTMAALADAGIDAAHERVDDRGAYESALGRGGFDLILADHQLPQFDGISALHLAREHRPEVPFIFVSGTLGEELAADAMKNGATDYVVKQRLNRLAPSVRRALREAEEHRRLREAQRDLRRSEERCRLLVESATDFAIIMLDPAGRVESWNGGAERILGFAEAEAVGRYCEFFFTPEDRAAGLPARALRMATEQGRSPDDRWHLRKDGSRFFASGVLTVLRDPDAPPSAPPVGFLKIMRDTTERKRQEESLQRSNDRLRLLSEVARYLLTAHDPKEFIDELFDKLSAHLGLEVYLVYLADNRADAEPSLRLFAAGNVPDDVRQRYARLAPGQGICGRVAASRERAVAEDVQCSADASADLVRSIGVTAYACYPLVADGQLLGTLSFGTRTRLRFEPEELELMQTVSDEIAAALHRARLLEREQTARREAEARKAEAEAANRAKDEFLATVSHELRTPLTAILGWARMLRAEDVAGDPETLNEGIAAIERNARSQAQLIEDILDISRIITGRLRLHVEPTDLAPVVHQALDAVRPAAEAKGVHLALDPHPVGLVSGDPVRLQQIVWNLLSNAIKFTPRGGTARLHVERLGSGGAEPRVRITVSDTGRGISPDFLPYVFDRFRQADASSTRRYGGLGLGLAIVKHLSELHGGTVEAHSDGDGKGATFTVTLPLLPAPDPPPRVAPPAPAADPAWCRPGPDGDPVLEGLRVLVVDDEPDARRLLATVLGRCKAQVATAADAAEAMRQLQSNRPDVLLSDIGMPIEDGYSLIRRVRELDRARGGPPTPAAALTAYTRAEDRTRALAAGFHMYVPKPVDPAELVAVVAKLAGRS